MWRQRRKPDFETPKKQDFIKTWKLKNEENNSKYQNIDKKEDRLDARNEPPRKVERMSTM
jgi:hypothetical protein